MSESSVVLEAKKISDISGQFVVPDYQRGYRWGKQQVKTLLDDLWTAANAQVQADYCLQPIVLKKMFQDGEPAKYELIDGQQRLTTIYILLSYLKRHAVSWLELNFSLDYETRKDTAVFLNNMTEEGASSNIDFQHIFNANKYIDEWFSETFNGNANKIGAGQNKLYTYMVEHLKVIWYEAGAEEDSSKMFTRLNIGRIKLTNAELIKALFLKGNAIEENNRERLEISMQWDSMEKLLCSENDEFWYFLTRENPKRYPTRIEFLFDLMAGKTVGEREEYFTFFKFDFLIRENTGKKVWEDIVNNFLRLKEWYEDNEFYHKIGYLISSGSTTMAEIFAAAQDKRKSEFKSCLEDMIKKSIDINAEDVEDYFELSYESDKQSISKLLLLFNVMSILKEEVYQRFPFSKYNTAEWSLEHIHAQQSQGLKTTEVQKKWLQMHLKSLKDVLPEGETELIEDVEAKSAEGYALTGTEFTELFEKVTAKLSEGSDLEYLHSISNMALLTKTDNAALNNSTFDVKRNQIVEMDQKGEFIPYCTKMVFLKYYTPSGDNQVHFWGSKDRKAYVEAIKRILSPFMTFKEKEA